MFCGGLRPFPPHLRIYLYDFPQEVIAVAKKRGPGKQSWALSAFFILLLSKLKGLLTLLKFSKIGGTLLTMVFSIGAYALMAPLPFAIGFVVLILIHELGHSIAAKQKGLPVSAPIFIPFLGALINMKRHPRDAVTEAYIAFGGPLLGSIGAAAFLLAGQWTDSRLLISLAYTGFFINLINLLPIHPLDGGRISTAVSRWLWLVGLIGGLYVIYDLKSWLFLIIWVLFAWELFQKYVWKREKPGKPYASGYAFVVPYSDLEAAGVFIPGEQHRRELPFTTWSDLNGAQTVQFTWDGYLNDVSVPLPKQAIVRRVQVAGVERGDDVKRLTIRVRIDWEAHVNDVYYEVPLRTRWGFGIAYAVLAGALGVLMYAAKHLLITPM
jgi:Zn-dependent protease